MSDCNFDDMKSHSEKNSTISKQIKSFSSKNLQTEKLRKFSENFIKNRSYKKWIHSFHDKVETKVKNIEMPQSINVAFS